MLKRKRKHGAQYFWPSKAAKSRLDVGWLSQWLCLVCKNLHLFYLISHSSLSHSPPSHLCTPNLQDYTATIFLRQRWTDERLVFKGNKSLSLDGRLVELLWVPDTFIVDSKKSFLHDITVENRLIRIFPNGTVLYALRWVTSNNKAVAFVGCSSSRRWQKISQI